MSRICDNSGGGVVGWKSGDTELEELLLEDDEEGYGVTLRRRRAALRPLA